MTHFFPGKDTPLSVKFISLEQTRALHTTLKQEHNLTNALFNTTAEYILPFSN